MRTIAIATYQISKDSPLKTQKAIYFGASDTLIDVYEWAQKCQKQAGFAMLIKIELIMEY